MGNLNSQFNSIKQMLPYFHAGGHLNNPTLLYVQEMEVYIDKIEGLNKNRPVT